MLGGSNWEFYIVLSDPFISKRCFDRTVLTFFKLVLDDSMSMWTKAHGFLSCYICFILIFWVYLNFGSVLSLLFVDIL